MHFLCFFIKFLSLRCFQTYSSMIIQKRIINNHEITGDIQSLYPLDFLRLNQRLQCTSVLSDHFTSCGETNAVGKGHELDN